MAGIRCQRCGRASGTNTLGWSTASRAGTVESMCDACTRNHVRDIESKLSEAWWSPDVRTVLVVEDDANTRLVIRLSLESAGYTVDEASNGEDAMALLDDSRRPAVVVVDVGLPGAADGWGVRDHARRVDPRVPVIMISAHGSIHDHDVPAVDGGDGLDFLAKPFDMDVLIDLVDRRASDQAGAGLA